MAELWIHFSDPGKAETTSLGPFDAEAPLRLTYNTLRHGAEPVAYLDEDSGDWVICGPWTGAGGSYSDIVIEARQQ